MVTETRNGEVDDAAGGSSGSDWTSEARRAIGGALLDAGRPLTSAEIAARLRGDQSNVRKLAEQMAADGVLLRQDPPKREKGRGRQPRTAYSLADEEIAPLRARIGEAGEILGLLRLQLQLLLVQVEEEQETHFFQVVDELGEKVGLQWMGRIDGPRQPYLLALEGEDAIQRAEVLRIALCHFEIDCGRYTVSQLLGGEAFVSSSRKSLQLTSGAVKKAIERDASWPLGGGGIGPAAGSAR